MEVADEFLAVRHAGLLQNIVHVHLHGAERDAHGRGEERVVLSCVQNAEAAAGRAAGLELHGRL